MATKSIGKNGGMGGSGVFGFFGTTIHCDSNDNSYYCLFMKFFNLIMVIFILYFLLKTFFPKITGKIF